MESIHQPTIPSPPGQPPLEIDQEADPQVVGEEVQLHQVEQQQDQADNTINHREYVKV